MAVDGEQEERNNELRSDLSDTEYNASAESNASSRRSSVDLPLYRLTLHNNNGETTRNDSEHESEVGMLVSAAIVVCLLCVFFFFSLHLHHAL